MGEGYFCLQTTLSLRSTKQGSIEPGLYIYIYMQLTSPLYTPMSPRLLRNSRASVWYLTGAINTQTLETLTHKLWKQKTQTRETQPNQIFSVVHLKPPFCMCWKVEHSHCNPFSVKAPACKESGENVSRWGRSHKIWQVSQKRFDHSGYWWVTPMSLFQHSSWSVFSPLLQRPAGLDQAWNEFCRMLQNTDRKSVV